MIISSPLTLNLLENSFEYLSTSLDYVIRARKEQTPGLWKFAHFNLITAIELQLKERLNKISFKLIYADPESCQMVTSDTETASWTVLIERNKSVSGQNIVDIDYGRLVLAQRLSNQMLNYRQKPEFPYAYYDYANLLDFFTKLFTNEIRKSRDDTLQNHIPPYLWGEVDDISHVFVDNFVLFNGLIITTELRDEILHAQSENITVVDGKKFKRIPFQPPCENSPGSDYSQNTCPGCTVFTGQIHLRGCGLELCPQCHEQMISCDCDYSNSDV